MINLLHSIDYFIILGHEPFVLYNLSYSIYIDRNIQKIKKVGSLAFKVSGLVDSLGFFLLPMASLALLINLNLIFFNLGLFLEPLYKGTTPSILSLEGLVDI